MSRDTFTTLFTGSATIQQVAVHDDKRKYLALYAKTGNCVVSFGTSDHTTEYITIAPGKYFEPFQPFTDAVYYTGIGSELEVITDQHRPAMMLYDGELLIYNGITLYWTPDDQKRTLNPPIFE